MFSTYDRRKDSVMENTVYPSLRPRTKSELRNNSQTRSNLDSRSEFKARMSLKSPKNSKITKNAELSNLKYNNLYHVENVVGDSPCHSSFNTTTFINEDSKQIKDIYETFDYSQRSASACRARSRSQAFSSQKAPMDQFDLVPSQIPSKDLKNLKGMK